MSLRKNFGLKWRVFQQIGLWEAIRYKYHHLIGGFLVRRGVIRAGAAYRLTAKGVRFPLFVRYNTSDRNVFEMIFVEQEYSCLRPASEVRLVVDCGANVGYASAYFLSRFADCHVIAVEPDPDNFALLKRNLQPYGNRVTLLNSGIWSHVAGLVVHRFGAGREWSTQVEECAPGEKADVQATDIPSLLALAREPRVNILKVDIEGAEIQLFNSECSSWLNCVDNIVVELHGEDCERVFMEALSGGCCDLSRSGELTVCQDLHFARVGL